MKLRIAVFSAGVALGALWLLGRTHERLSKRKPTTTKSQPRRQTVIKRGWDVLQAARKRRQMPSLPPPPAPRVLEYQRHFPGYRLPCDASLVELW